MKRILALPAPSAARTRERNKRAREEKNKTARVSFTIHNAAPGAKLWTVCAYWNKWDGESCLTSSIHVAMNEAEAKKRHKAFVEKTLHYDFYLTVISATLAGEVQP